MWQTSIKTWKKPPLDPQDCCALQVLQIKEHRLVTENAVLLKRILEVER